MIVAYYGPHNDGIEYGIMDEPGQDTGSALVDLYEFDGQIRTFKDRDDATAWLRTRNPNIPAEGGIGPHVHFEYPPLPNRRITNTG